MSFSKNKNSKKIEVEPIIEAQANETDSPVENIIDDNEEALNLAQVAELEQSVVEWQTKAGEYLDGWQRSRADFANYKKRIEREQAEVYQRAAGSILKRHLEAIDDLERALRTKPLEGEGAIWSEGIELVYRKLTNIIESEGVKTMQAEGQMFDPTLHEAISSEDSPDHQSGEIIQVLQKGYLLGDKVLRPALVRVAR